MDEKLTLQEFHKKQAIELFNATWDLIDVNERTHKQDVDMIHTAHASRYHWGQVGTELHFARGEWQISRVYALVGNGESALYHGKESLRLCKENGIGDFDLAFAYEAVARAYSVIGDEEKKMEALVSAKDAAKLIEKDEDKEYVMSEIDSI